MKIRLARHMGLCFGVKDAIQLAEERARHGPTTILGPLAHNQTIQQRLTERGVAFVERHQDANTRDLIITAHGISNHTRQSVQDAGFNIRDATCPLVHFAHRTLHSLVQDGFYPIIIGKRDHIEVRGLTGDLRTFSIVEEASDIDEIPHVPRIGIVSQTTQPIERVRAWVQQIEDRFPDSKVCFKDTVCQPTKQRQSAALNLGRSCDVVIVIGGKNSNNTHQLTETVSRHCERVHQIERVADLDPDWFLSTDEVGVTAGTSTPGEVIRPILERLTEWARSSREPALLIESSATGARTPLSPLF
jgi:4-hydroxy-3-methylbut-2-en-1-yl diphosphate reductase